MSSSYWKSVMDRLGGSAPQKTNYYNQDFENEINAAKGNIDNLVSEQDRANSEKNSAMDTYNAFQGSMKSYGEIWKTGYDDFGVKQYQDEYEKSKQALAQAQASLAALPSQITAGSNVALTKSQKEAMYNKLSDIRTRNISTMEAGVQKQMDAWTKAREGAQAYASGATSAQQSQLANYNQVWVNAVNKYNTAGTNLLKARIELNAWENEYANWKSKAWRADYRTWSARYAAASSNYAKALANERIKANADARAQRQYNEAKENYAKAVSNYKYYSENIGRATASGAKFTSAQAEYYKNLALQYKAQLAL